MRVPVLVLVAGHPQLPCQSACLWASQGGIKSYGPKSSLAMFVLWFMPCKWYLNFCTRSGNYSAPFQALDGCPLDVLSGPASTANVEARKWVSGDAHGLLSLVCCVPAVCRSILLVCAVPCVNAVHVRRKPPTQYAIAAPHGVRGAYGYVCGTAWCTPPGAAFANEHAQIRQFCPTSSDCGFPLGVLGDGWVRERLSNAAEAAKGPSALQYGNFWRESEQQGPF